MRRLLRKGFIWSLTLLLLSVPTLAGAAPNKIMVVPGTRLTFQDSGGTATFTGQNLGTGEGRYSARYDKNALVTASGAMPYLWQWDVSVRLASSGTIGDVVEVYIVKSDGTRAQGNLGTTDAALTTDKRKNLTLVGVLVLDQTATGTTMVASGYVEIRERYFSVALWNATAVNLVNTANLNIVGMTPTNVEIQAHAPLDYDNRTAVPALVLAA